MKFFQRRPPIDVFQGDITKLPVDVIVNAANEAMLGGGGVDGAIHKAAGPGLLEECRTVGGCKTGQVVTTHAYDLPAKWIVHAVGPIYTGSKEDAEALASCYANAICAADLEGAETIAFPAISTGIYGYPPREAAKIAVRTIKKKAKRTSLRRIFLVAFSDEDFDVLKGAL